MLPVESLADFVAFFKYFDLGSLLLTNKKFSDVARQVTGRIRISDLSGFDFVVTTNIYYYVHTRDMNNSGIVHSARFANEVGFAEFVSEAFRHCVVGNLLVDWCSGRVLSAIKEAAKTLTVTDTLTIEAEPSVTVPELVDFIDTFRQVTTLRISFSLLHARDTDLSAIKSLCRRKSIEWVTGGWRNWEL